MGGQRLEQCAWEQGEGWGAREPCGGPLVVAIVVEPLPNACLARLGWFIQLLSFGFCFGLAFLFFFLSLLLLLLRLLLFAVTVAVLCCVRRRLSQICDETGTVNCGNLCCQRPSVCFPRYNSLDFQCLGSAVRFFFSFFHACSLSPST